MFLCVSLAARLTLINCWNFHHIDYLFISRQFDLDVIKNDFTYL